MTENSEKAILVNAKDLKQITCIQYLIAFLGSITQDGSILNPVLVFFDLGSEVNAIHLTFEKKLDLVM